MSDEREEKREKAQKLLNQAFDDSVEREERDAFLIRAAKIVYKYKLLELTPVEGVLDHPTVRAMKTVADKFYDPDFKEGLGVLFDVAKSTVASASAEAKRRRRR